MGNEVDKNIGLKDVRFALTGIGIVVAVAILCAIFA